MRLMADALSAAGFEPKPYGYASTRATIAQLGTQLAKDVRANHRKRPVYAVTHSLGGIILRCAPREGVTWRRIVMLAPPNNGSAMAAALSGVALEALLGPSAMELGRVSAEEIKAWPFPPAPFAVIAGTRRRSWLTPASWLSGRVFGDVDHDGTVTVEETKLDGMAAFETIDASHTTIMHDPRVHELTVSFLRNGWFTRPPGDVPATASDREPQMRGQGSSDAGAGEAPPGRRVRRKR